MTSRVQVATGICVAVLVTGVVAGCTTTVPGTVAMTTEPGSSISTRQSSPSTSPRTPRSSTPRTPSNAPGDAQSVTCGEFVELTPEDQTSTLTEVMGMPPQAPSEDLEMLRVSFDSLCQFMPEDITLGELMAGGPP